MLKEIFFNFNLMLLSKNIKAFFVAAFVGITLSLFPASCLAMDFDLFFQADYNLNVITAQGEIKEGDAETFLEISRRADRDKEGDVILILNSLGGSVNAAFKLVDVMDEVGVYAIVPPEGLCASACASIVYVSARRRNLLPRGRLGFHSCYKKDGVTKEASSLCNEIIADNAMKRGLDHASVSLFVDDYDADQMAWVGPDVACTMLYGMCRPSLDESEMELDNERYFKMQREMVESFSKSGPSFSCKKAETEVEKLICSDDEVSLLDKKMASLYQRQLSNVPKKELFKKIQSRWLKEIRSSCENKKCLIEAYNNRISEIIETIKSY